ncbi:MAG: hypothetical protein GXP21_07605 [Gammaproteobacteria bacterium]|nr:hypothetical protein [Gammaproteobacteria bacterium]
MVLTQIKLKGVLLIVALAVLTTACASSKSGKVYSRDETQNVQVVEVGTVIAIEDVLIEGTKTPIGAAAGTVVGGVIGAGSANSSGDRVRGVLGAVIGGVVGAAAEEGFTRRKGQEITIELDGGGVISIVQEADQHIAINDTVRILTQPNGTKRVTR